MARSKRTEKDVTLSAHIGQKISEWRSEKGWTIVELAQRIGVSASHLKALEAGRYSFTAGQLWQISVVLERPLAAMLPDPPHLARIDPAPAWNKLYERLAPDMRLAMMEFGQRLTGHPDASLARLWKRAALGPGRLVSFEGIDGLVLQDQANRLVAGLRRTSPARTAMPSFYDHSTGLWQFIFRLSADGAMTGSHQAFERTLLFACERVSRQEHEIRAPLREGATVVALFFWLAARVYQGLEGLQDFTVVESISSYLVEPDLVVLLDSDPAQAARRAVRHAPGPGTFYSPYSGEAMFDTARHLHLDAARGQTSGPPIRVVNADREAEVVAAEVLSFVARADQD